MNAAEKRMELGISAWTPEWQGPPFPLPVASCSEWGYMGSLPVIKPPSTGEVKIYVTFSKIKGEGGYGAEPWALFRIYIRAVVDSIGKVAGEKRVFEHQFDHFDQIDWTDKTYTTSLFLKGNEYYSIGPRFYLEASITGVEGVGNVAWASFYDGYGDIEIDSVKVVLQDE